jgi:hypothetical protein
MRLRAVTAVAFLVLCLGCGNSGPRTSPVTGVVELDGDALTEGDMTFLPKGSGGRAAGARVKDGKYAADVEDGTYSVKITASKKVPLGPGEPSVSGEKEKLVSIIPARFNEKTELTIEVKGATQKDFKLTKK